MRYCEEAADVSAFDKFDGEYAPSGGAHALYSSNAAETFQPLR